VGEGIGVDGDGVTVGVEVPGKGVGDAGGSVEVEV